MLEPLSRVDISVMFECFHFQHFEQVSQRYIFLFVFTNLFLQFTAATLNVHSEWTQLNSELLFFPKGRVLFFLCIILLFMCGTV